MKERSFLMLYVFCFVLGGCSSVPHSLRSDRLSSAMAMASPLATTNTTPQFSHYPIITNEMADKLCLTMTLSEVEAILSRPGQIVNNGSTTDKVQTYEWRNPDGSRVWATFVEGKLMGAGTLGLPGIAKEFDPFEPPPEGPLSESCLQP